MKKTDSILTKRFGFPVDRATAIRFSLAFELLDLPKCKLEAWIHYN